MTKILNRQIVLLCMLVSVMMTGCNRAEDSDPPATKKSYEVSKIPETLDPAVNDSPATDKSQEPFRRPSVELPEVKGFNKDEIVGLLQSASDKERIQIIQKILSLSRPHTVYIGAIYPYLTDENADVAFYARAYFISVINDEYARNYLGKRSESAAPELKAILLDIMSQYKKDHH